MIILNNIPIAKIGTVISWLQLVSIELHPDHSVNFCHK